MRERAHQCHLLAGELAIEWGILPWTANSALLAAVEIFNHWKATQPKSDKSKEHTQILNGVRDFIETRGADFSDVDWVPERDSYGRLMNPEPVIHERAGYWKDLGKRVYFFNVAGLERASSGFGSRKAAEVLDDAGPLIQKDPGKRTKKTCRAPWLLQAH
jgi:putative DNA primase/helicase